MGPGGIEHPGVHGNALRAARRLSPLFEHSDTALAVVTILMLPVMVGAALLIGLGDTWLDVREKARTLAT